MAVLRRKEDGMGFSGKRSLPAYMDLKKEKDVLKELHRFLEETLTEPEVLKKRKEYLRFGDQLYLLPPGTYQRYREKRVLEGASAMQMKPPHVLINAEQVAFFTQAAKEVQANDAL